jgi:putative transposase
LKTLAERYPKYGCPTLHDMLVIEGEVKNHKRTYRIYCEEGLQVRTKKRKKLRRPRVPMLVPDAVNPRWSMDFVSDQLANGRRFCVMNVVDDFSREYVLKVVDFSISVIALHANWIVSQGSCQRRSSATTDQSLRRRQCTFGQRRQV